MVSDETRRLVDALEYATRDCARNYEYHAECLAARAALDAHLAKMHEKLRIAVSTLETIANDPDDTAIEALSQIRALDNS